MASISQNLVGKRVYRSSSYAPNRGTVDPSGYLLRELRKRGVSQQGGDGASDTRSGLAQSALRGRPIAFGGPKANSPRPPFGGPKDGRPVIGDGSKANSPRPPFGGPKDGRPIAGGPRGISAVNINKNGRLDLPFDFQSSAGAIEKQRQANEALFQLQTEGQKQAQEYLRTKRNMGQEFEGLQRSTLNDNAGRGTAFSSGYGLQVGQNANAFNQSVNDLDMQNSMFTQQQDQERANITAGLQMYLQQQALERGHNLHSKAGSLGYGKNPKPKPKAKPKKKRK